MKPINVGPRARRILAAGTALALIAGAEIVIVTVAPSNPTLVSAPTGPTGNGGGIGGGVGSIVDQ